ncbi:MAG: ABC transporter permease [Azospirillum brasilense]|nr:MAG: ABC transporter permease [Azospirillum brasilense]
MLRLRERAAPYLLLLPVLLLMTVFVYLPIVANIRFSLYRWSSLSPDWVFVGAANYIRLFNDPLFWVALWNNILYAAISLVVQVGFALVLAAILESPLFSRRLAGFFRVALFIPSILPITVIGILWQLIYQPAFGLLNAALEGVGLGNLSRAWLGEEGSAMLSVIAVSQWQWTGYITVLFIVAIRAIPRDLYEAAEIDGAGLVRQFFAITVPSVRQTTFVMTMITIFGAIKVFDIVWIMTGGGPNDSSHTLGTYMYRSAFQTDAVGYGAAVAVVMFALSSVFGLLNLWLQRRG